MGDDPVTEKTCGARHAGIHEQLTDIKTALEKLDGRVFKILILLLSAVGALALALITGLK